MNAYDIAKDLDREGKFPGHVCYGTSPLLVRAANMLRKQADRIAELEKRKWSEQDIKNACISARLSEEDFFRIKAYLPVYSSPQTKPLSDEEINEIKTLMEINYGCVPPLEFAWAIEERHGIK